MTAASLFREIVPNDFGRWLLFRLKIYVTIALISAWGFLLSRCVGYS